MNTLLAFILLFVSLPLMAQPQEEEIVVRLGSEKELLPLYLAPTRPQDAVLRDILAFDLNHNGMTRVLSSKEVSSCSSLKSHEAYDAPLDFDKLKKDNILYMVKLNKQENLLTAKIISINSQTGHTIDNISLSGDIAKDRVKMHKLADAIHKVLFGKEGIASCRILYCTKNKMTSEVFEADYDGKNARQITHEKSLCTHPIYMPSHNGSKSRSFLYVSYKIGQPKIYLSSLDTHSPIRASKLRGNQVTPSLYQNGSLLAFACDTTGRSDIFIQPLSQNSLPNNLPRQIFTATAAANASPTFSPNGKQIAFVSNKDGSPKIYVMDIPKPGTKLQEIATTLISKRCRENSAPMWSPDGKKLAYCSKAGGARQIWIYDFETKTERQLTEGVSDKENPSWAPNSLHLLFNATDKKGTELYLINLNQPKAVKITSGSGGKFFPSWEPKNL